VWWKVTDSSSKTSNSWVIRASTISQISSNLCSDQLCSSISSSTSIAHGICWVSSTLNHVVCVFIFLLAEVYTIWYFSIFFLGRSLSLPSSELPADVFLISIPLILCFVLNKVFFREMVSELGFVSATSMPCWQNPSLVLINFSMSFKAWSTVVSGRSKLSPPPSLTCSILVK